MKLLDFLHVDANSRKLKIENWVGMIRNGCGKSVHGTLKSTASQKATD